MDGDDIAQGRFVVIVELLAFQKFSAVAQTVTSENAVRLAMEKLILPELGHLVKELTK